MASDAPNPLDDFAHRYLTETRGARTSILHLGDKSQRESVRSALAADEQTLVTVPLGGDDDVRGVLETLKPRSADVIIATEPILETDFPWVTMMQIARTVRPGGYACFALGGTHARGLSDSWFATMDGVVELAEWANLEALDLISNRGGRLLVARSPKTKGFRGALNRAKLRLLRAVSIQESERRVEHLRIRRGQRRQDAREALILDPTQAPLDRAQYKETWQRVSGDANTAKISVAGYYDEASFEKAALETVEALEKTTGLHDDDMVLEIGAGVGRVGPAIAPRVKRWIATDVSSNMLQHAKQRCEGLANVDFVEISGWDLAPIPDSSVDLVYCTVVFMHLDEWDRYAYVCEAMRVLRPGGRLYVDGINLCGEDGWALFFEHYASHDPLERPPNISKTSTPQELETYLRRAGFVDIHVDYEPEGLWVTAYGWKGE